MNKKILDKILLNILSIFLMILFLMPFYLLIVNSLKSKRELFSNTLGLPHHFIFENYSEAFKVLGFAHALVNSFLITTFGVVLLVVFPAMAAWVLVRYKTKTSSFIFMLFALSMLIPFQSVMFPLLRHMGALHLRNIFGLTLLYLGFGSSLCIFLFHGFIKGISLELEESAHLDGYPFYKIFFLIVFPLLKPILVTVAVLNIIWIWNDYLLPSLILSSEYYTIPLKMATLFGQYSKRWDIALPALIMSITPVLIFYFGAQRHIVKGITAGSIK